MKKIPYALTVTLSLLLSAPLMAASFDCSHANLPAEKTICSNEYLSALDKIMSGFYSKVQHYSFNTAALKTQQKQWWDERNQCGDDTDCLQKSYESRIKQLESIYGVVEFKPIDKSKLSYVLAKEKKAVKAETHTDFTSEDRYWDVRPFYDRLSELNDILKQQYNYVAKGTPDIVLEDYRIENNTLYIYAKLSYSWDEGFLVELTDHTPPKVITHFKGNSSLLSISQNKGAVIYYIQPSDDSGQPIQINEWLSTSNQSAPIKGVEPKDYARYLKDLRESSIPWLGLCGEDVCYSYRPSPNNIWQAATKTSNDAIYLFPNNKPRDGKMIIENFSPDITDDGGSADRNLVWLDDNTLFFDNATAYACIWRADIKRKHIEKIIPFHDVQVPFPIKFNGQEYLLFIITEGGSLPEIYIARAPEEAVNLMDLY